MKYLIVAGAFLFAAPAFAQVAPDPSIQALGQMLGEAQQREAVSLARAYAAEAKVKTEAARADAAEKKLTAPKP